MKRQRYGNISNTDEYDGDGDIRIDKEVHKHLKYLATKCCISLDVEDEEIDLEYDTCKDNIREYVLKVGVKGVCYTTYYFTVEILQPGDPEYNEHDVMFMFGEDTSDEFNYDTEMGYTRSEIEDLKYAIVDDNYSFLPPFIHVEEGELICEDDCSESLFKLNSFEQKSMSNFKRQYTELLSWILNKIPPY